ncbi:hypothetical protein MASR1M46_15550 [Bacteroidales bacterium]
MLRTDGKENLISSIEIAARDKNGKAIVPEVCVYFESQLYRGNRTTKYNAENFRAFRSANFPVLADIGIHIRYNDSLIIRSPAENQFKIHTNLDTSVAILKIFPGITEEFIKSFLSIKNIKAILETYGSGNAPTSEWFINALKEAIQRDIIILNITQCQAE